MPSSILVNRQAENIVINVAPPSAGTYDLIVYAKPKDDSNEYGEIISYQIEASSSTVELPKIYGHFHRHPGEFGRATIGNPSAKLVYLF